MVINCFFILAMAVIGLDAAGEVSDYVYWMKADMTAWHQFFPSRALEEERMTNELAETAVQAVSQGMADSLSRLVAYQEQELQTAQLMMDGTSAQGCVQGISGYINNAILDAISKYEDCSADSLPRLRRLNTSWTRTNDKYQAAYQRALAGIDNCARTYPNRDSLSRLRVCVQAWNNNYMSTANTTQRDATRSPAMLVFTDRVAICAESAAQAVVAAGWGFLDKLVHCAKLSENIDAQLYEPLVSMGFSNYLTQNNLTGQIQAAQYINNGQVSQLERVMLFFYDLQKRALEKYAIESHNQGYYSGKLHSALHTYFATVSATATDNPASAECASQASGTLYNIINEGSAAAVKCDQNIVNDTKFLIARVNSDFSGLNSQLPHIGNPAILSCFTEGYMFAENTIFNCFILASSGFSVNATEVHSRIFEDVDVLLNYERSFFNNTSLPCAESILRRAYLGAETALYNLQRCLYIDSGTKYAVTAYPPTQPSVPV